MFIRLSIKIEIQCRVLKSDPQDLANSRLFFVGHWGLAVGGFKKKKKVGCWGGEP